MIGVIAIIFVLLPESPWWLVSKGKSDKAAKVLGKYNSSVHGYNVQEQIVGYHWFSHSTFALSFLSFPIHVFVLLIQASGYHDGNHQRRAPCRGEKFGAWQMGYLSWTKLVEIFYCWLAEGYSAICWIDRLQHVCYLLL
jgi:Sugar (and other) transporter